MDITTPSGRLMLTVFGACAELERAYILDRQREGIEIKNAAGGYSGENHRGRSKTEMDWELFESLMQKYLNQEISASQCAAKLGINHILSGVGRENTGNSMEISLYKREKNYRTNLSVPASAIRSTREKKS